jgi:nucleotide-binding universal stress UspA family protein
MFKHLLVPTDGAKLSDDTVVKAVTFARETGARITFFHAEPSVPTGVYSEAALPEGALPNAPEDFARAAEAHATEVLGRCEQLAKQAGVPCDARTAVTSSPYEAIIDAAESAECDLIFMASHGRRGLSGLLLGSETHKVLTHTKIPVLVFR